MGLFAHGVTLEWDRNPETNVTGYRVYAGRQSRVYDSVLDVTNQTVATIAAPAGKSFYAVTAYNIDGLESDFSDEVSYTPPWSNSPPQARPDQYTATKNVARLVSRAGGVLVNDSDVDPQPLTALLVTPPTHGVVALSPDGSFVYTPSKDFVGPDSFWYSVSDGSLTSAAATVTITVSDGPPPGSQSCSNCLVNIDALLAARSADFPSLIAARENVPTNITCPQLGVFLFSTISRAARSINDAELDAVLASTAECLAGDFGDGLNQKILAASELLPSIWTVTASNQVATASRYLAGISASSSNSLRQARLLANAAAILSRLEKTIAAGNLAPTSLVNDVATARIFNQGQMFQITFRFGENSFSLEDTNGIINAGQYSFARTAWNSGSLVLVPQQNLFQHEQGESVTVALRFGRTRHRMTAEGFRGYFILQD